MVKANAKEGQFVAKLGEDSTLAAGQSAHLEFDAQRTFLFRNSKVCGTVNIKGAK